MAQHSIQAQCGPRDRNPNHYLSSIQLATSRRPPAAPACVMQGRDSPRSHESSSSPRRGTVLFLQSSGPLLPIPPPIATRAPLLPHVPHRRRRPQSSTLSSLAVASQPLHNGDEAAPASTTQIHSGEGLICTRKAPTRLRRPQARRDLTRFGAAGQGGKLGSDHATKVEYYFTHINFHAILC